MKARRFLHVRFNAVRKLAALAVPTLQNFGQNCHHK
jgi:hypothetical protein